MIKIVVFSILFILLSIASCFTSSDGKIVTCMPDFLAIFAGGTAVFALYKEYQNRNRDNDKMIYVNPILLLIPLIEEINDELDIISNMTIHNGCENLKKSLDDLQVRATNLALKISNRLQKTDQKCKLNDKVYFESYMEEKIYPHFVHLSQNLQQDENTRKIFKKDLNELKQELVCLVTSLTNITNNISDKL